MSNKRNVVLYLDKDLVEKTRELGFNLSYIFVEVEGEAGIIKKKYEF